MNSGRIWNGDNCSKQEKNIKKFSVSFVILTKNSEKYLCLCLESIIHQKYPNFEIVIVDGGSIDNTLKIIENYSQKSQRIKVVPAPGSSIGYARQIGTETSRGDIIAFIDSDCELPSDSWLSEMLSGFDSPEIAGVWTLGAFHPDDPSVMRYSILSNPIRDRISRLDGNAITRDTYIAVGTGHILMRRDIIQEAGGFLDINAAEDIDLTYRIVNLGYKLRYKKGCEVFHYHVSSLKQLIRKNRRNIAGGLNSEVWKSTYFSRKNLELLLSLSIIFPFIFAGYMAMKDRDPAWFWHPIVNIFKILTALSVFLSHSFAFGNNT